MVLAFVLPEKDVVWVNGSFQVLGGRGNGAGPCLACIWVHIMGEMKAWYPIYFQGPVTYVGVAE